jgi:hypothetical protein
MEGKTKIDLNYFVIQPRKPRKFNFVITLIMIQLLYKTTNVPIKI